MQRIDLMIVGAQKAGTTALKEYLAEHPQFLTHIQREFSFFKDKEEYEVGFSKAFDKFFHEQPHGRKLVAKNAGMYFDKNSLERLAKHNKDCKILFIVRKPVERLQSAYSMEKFNGWLNYEFNDFKSVLERKDYQHILYRLFIKLGLYSEHLKMLYDFFPKEQLKVVSYEDLKKDPQVICQDIFEWMGVDKNISPDELKRYNETKIARSALASLLINELKKESNPIKKLAKRILPYHLFSKLGNRLVEFNKSKKKPEQPSKEVVNYIANYYAPYNEEFERLTGIKFNG